jgi:hypothetical protein
MKLEKFKTDRSKKIRNILLTLGAIIILVGGIIFYRSYALYEEDKTFNVIRGQVPEFTSSDMQIAYTVNGVKTTEAFPKKGTGYVSTSVTCENGVTAKWDNDVWGLINIDSNESGKIKCTIDFVKYLKEYLTDLAETDITSLVYDGTTDNNLRYIGTNPNNYLCFDKDCTNGKWRVIGVMNNMTTASNGNQSLVKIIRAEPVGSNKWDANDWTIATLQTNLNSGDLYTTYIKNYDNLFESVTWNLGGVSWSELTTAVPSIYYELERGKSVYTDRPTKWIGKIGLMYPSDYGYATSGGSTTDRKTCISTALYSWNSYSDCYNSNYLFSDDWPWLITPNSNDSIFVLAVYGAGHVDIYGVGYSGTIHPVGYLVSSAKILSGDGTSSSPWIISA